ncbi:hypothetical protein KAI56_03040 [Candidatus Parcubacteria bacterium]|nr:hypothetical protein [Candidatus Parcubacteria bacterium]
MKFFSETVNTNPEDSDSEKINEYDQPASQEEISGLREEVEKKIEKKAEEIRASETEDIEIYKDKVIELAGLDMESLDVKSLENSSHIDLELIRDNINETVNRFQIDKDTKDLKEKKLSKFEKFVESIRKHKKPLALGELSLYLSTLGAPALNFLVDENVKVKISDKEVSLEDLVDNPELIKMIDKCNSTNTPLSIGKEFFSTKPLDCEKVKISFKEPFAHSNILCLDIRENSEAKDIETKEVEEICNKIKEELRHLNKDSNPEAEDIYIEMKNIEENKIKVAETISSHTSASKNEVLDYISDSLELNTSKISVVEFEDFEINSNSDISLAKIKGTNIESFNDLFVENNTIETKIIDRELFNNLLEQKLKEDGYTISKLKNIANDNPKEVIKILTQTLGKNIEYDYKKLELIQSQKKVETMEEFADLAKEIGKQNPYETLKNERGICFDYAQTVSMGIDFLDHKDVLNQNDFKVLTTTSHSMDHGWNILFSTDKDGNLVFTFMDLDCADDDKEENISKIPENLNAVDDKHYYSGIIKKVNETHQTALEKIKDYNILAFQENLKKILMQYDPKHKPEIEVSKKAFEEITKKKTRSSREDKKDAVNSLP